MNKTVIIALILVFLMVTGLSACQSQPTDLPSEPVITTSTQPLVTHTSTPTVTATPIPTPELPLNGQQTRYKLNLIMNYYNQFATVTEEITYTNKSSDILSELLLIVNPRYYPGSFSLKTLTNASDQPITVFSWDNINLHIPLFPSLSPGDQITLELTYSLVLPEHEGTFGISGRQLNLANWYPYIPPYRDEVGWIVHDMHLVNSTIVGEYLAYESSDFDVSLQFTDRRENIEVAASAPASEQGRILQYQLELARGFAFSMSDSYVEYEIEQEGVIIRSYVFPGHEASGVAAAEIAARSISLFGELLIPYPRKMFSVVEAEFLHNMEFDGMTLINYGVLQFYDGKTRNNLTILTPHETSHQWFYSLVGNDQALEPWLDEALATYCEVLYYDRYHPEDVQWWWDSRVTGYDPTGYVDSSIYFPDGYYPYIYAVYLRGAMFLQTLRDAVGDEAFFGSLKEYVATYAYTIATGEDFFAILAKHSNVDLTPILAEYFDIP